MDISAHDWAHAFDPDNAVANLKEGGEFRTLYRQRQGLDRAVLVDNRLTDGIEGAVGTKGLKALLASTTTGGHLIRGGTFAADVATAVKNARAVLTVALLSLDGSGRGKEVLRARDICSATVLLLAAEYGLQACARGWFEANRGSLRQLGRLNMPGIGAALLSAHMSGPIFPEDVLPNIAGSLLAEVAA
ncbi:hypothetical protein [Azospirillum soli]|uniref:hypothetical protein n=1 Tax=Azospirillum soli TaxID=1304799 RepID=UPI001AEB28C6|nr:hypothetical protein [Azospirillum soli]MBP2311907.1 hypothetical protein [Azospirillum soli]